MKALKTLAVATLLVMAWTTASFAAPNAAGLSKKIESFNFFVDYSGSMMMSHKELGKEKMQLAKDILTKVNTEIPALNYSGGLYTFAPYGEKLKQSPWDRDKMGLTIDALKIDLGIFDRLTEMGDGIQAHNKVVSGMTPKAGVIMISDGESNRGLDPVEQAKLMYQQNPHVCLHIISLADTPEGQAVLDKIAKINPCTVMVMGSDLLASPKALQKFVKDVFYDDAEVVVLRGVTFAFDSDKLDATAQGVLREAVKYIKGPVEVHGFTCSIGSKEYNLGLSQRRANSVKMFLQSSGVKTPITAIGNGISHTYDNSNEEGRRMNRRVELHAK